MTTQAPERRSAVWDGATVRVEPGAASGDPELALRQAAKLAATEPFCNLAGFLLAHIGPAATAKALGVPDARQLTKWAYGKGEPKQQSMVERVHLLFQIAYAITYGLSGANARGFLLTGNPDLDHEAPVTLLRGDVADARIPLLSAVARLLE